MRYFAFLAIAAYICLSVTLSVRPGWFGFLDSIPGRDKLAHFVVAGLLCFFMVAGLSTISVRGRALGPLVCLLAAAVLITLDELIQLAIVVRTFALADLGWSYAGILVFGAFAVWVRRIQGPAR